MLVAPRLLLHEWSRRASHALGALRSWDVAPCKVRSRQLVFLGFSLPNLLFFSLLTALEQCHGSPFLQPEGFHFSQAVFWELVRSVPANPNGNPMVWTQSPHAMLSGMAAENLGALHAALASLAQL